MRSVPTWLTYSVCSTLIVTFPLLLHFSPSTCRIASLFFISLIIMAGLQVVTGFTKTVSLCHATLVGVGAYGAAISSSRFAFSTPISIGFGIIMAVFVASLVVIATARVNNHYLAMATLGISELVGNTFRGASEFTGGANGLSNVPPLAFGSTILDTPPEYYPICSSVGLAALTAVYLLERSTLGKALRAVGDVGIRAEALGLNVYSVRGIGFILAAAFAGTAGALTAHVDGFVGPESFGLGLSISYLCFLVIGGLGTIRGLVIGAALASVGTEFLRGLVAWQMVVISLVSLLALYARAKRFSSIVTTPNE